MSIDNQIQSILENSLNCKILEVIDESSNHSRGGVEAHFKVVVVSDDFLALSMIERHKKLNFLLIDIFPQVHALSLRPYDKNEWQKLKSTPTSPLCASKR